MRCAAKTAVTRSVVMKSSPPRRYLPAMTRLSGKGGLRRALAAAWRKLEVSRNRVSRRFPPPPRHSAGRPRKSQTRSHFAGGGRVEPAPFDFFPKQASVRAARAAEPAHCEFPFPAPRARGRVGERHYPSSAEHGCRGTNAHFSHFFAVGRCHRSRRGALGSLPPRRESRHACEHAFLISPALLRLRSTESPRARTPALFGVAQGIAYAAICGWSLRYPVPSRRSLSWGGTGGVKSV